MRYIFNEIVSKAPDEIQDKSWMKLNPSFYPPKAISSRSDFIHEVDFFRRKTDLAEKSTLLYARCFFLEAPPRFELGIRVLQTHALPLGYSAILTTKDAYCVFRCISGAEDEIRTRDVHLGKVTLYH